MTKEVIDIHIADLLERIHSVERLINMYKQTGYEDGSMFMIEQYSARKEEFVGRLNKLRKKALKLESIPVSKRAYAYEELLVESGTHEPVRAYIEKEEFVERLTPLRKKALKSEQMPVSKRTYTYEEPLALSVAHEPVRPYGAKDEPTT